jgi:hypothetical protein
MGAVQIRGHGHFYGDLWSYLNEGLPEGTVRFGVSVEEVVGADTGTPQLLVGDEGSPRSFDLIIGADGGKSTIRQYVHDELPTYAGYTLWRGLCPTRGVSGPPSGSADRNGVSYQTLGFKCNGPGGSGGGGSGGGGSGSGGSRGDSGTLWNCGVYMMMPESEVDRPTRNRQVKAGMKEVPQW